MTMKSDYKVRARHFLEEIWPYIENCGNEPYQYRIAMRKYNFHKSRHVLVGSGCVRVALVTSDYVIKFDYCPEEARRVGGCADEAKFYAFAKSKGFAHLFAESTPFIFHNRAFFIMPRIEGIGRYEDAYVQEFLNDDDRDFVDEYLYDMHDQNYGWKNGYPVIIDYACSVFLPPWEQPDSEEEVSSY